MTGLLNLFILFILFIILIRLAQVRRSVVLVLQYERFVSVGHVWIVMDKFIGFRFQFTRSNSESLFLPQG